MLNFGTCDDGRVVRFQTGHPGEATTPTGITTQWPVPRDLARLRFLREPDQREVAPTTGVALLSGRCTRRNDLNPVPRECETLARGTCPHFSEFTLERKLVFNLACALRFREYT